jgi:O-antigen ligase
LSQESEVSVNKQAVGIANLVVILGVVFFLTQSLDAFNYPKTFVASTGIFALFLALIIHRRFLLNFRNLHPIELFLIGMALLTIILASFNDLFSFLTLWGSFSRANGLLAKVSLLLLALIYFRFSSKDSISRFFLIAFFLLIVEVAYGAIQLTGNDPVPWVNPYNNIFVTAGNPNFGAALFAILVVLNFRHIFSSSKWNLRFVGGVSVVAGIYMSYATQSVQGILTIAAAVFLLCLIAIFRYITNRNLKIGLFTLSTLAALPIALGVFNFGPLRGFLFQETLAIRLHYWRIALKILGDYPLFGVGIDRYGDYYRLYREPWFVEKYGPGLISTNAHNVALQWGTDLGVLGIFMYVSLFVIATLVYFRQAKFRVQKKFTDLDFLYVSFFAFYLQSLISISQLSVTILGFALLGLVLSYVLHDNDQNDKETRGKIAKQRSRIRKSNFIGLGTWWLIFVLIFTPFTSSIVRNDLALRQALQLPGIEQQVSDLLPRSTAIEAAVQPFLEDQDYVSLAIQNLYSQGNAQTGLKIAEQSVEVNTRSWVGYQSQVLAYAQSNLPQKAVEVAKKALELDPLNYNIQFNLAEQAYKAGQVEVARRYAELVFKSAPPGSEVYIGAEKLLRDIGK